MKKRRIIEIIISIVLFTVIVLTNVYVFKVQLTLFYLMTFCVASILIVLSYECLSLRDGYFKTANTLLMGIDILILSEMYLNIKFTPIVAIIFLFMFMILITSFSILGIYFIINFERDYK